MMPRSELLAYVARGEEAASDMHCPARLRGVGGFRAEDAHHSAGFSGNYLSPARFGNNLIQAVSGAGIMDELWLSWPVLNRFNGEA